MQRGKVWLSALFYALTLAVSGFSQELGPRSPQQTLVIPPDLNASFQVVISMTVKPETPTSYDRTSISIESNPQMTFEVVEIKDETRGITSKAKGNSANLVALFGPKKGLTDKVVVSALVRIPRQSGEKVVRRTIRLRNVPPEIWHNVERRGRVRIEVQLDLPTEGRSTEDVDSAAARQEALAHAQDELVISLAGTDYKFLRTFESGRSFLLEAGPSALAVLDRLPNVTKITEDASFRVFAQ